MAHRLPDPPRPERRQWARNWIAYDRYRVIHENSIESLIAEGIVTADDTRFRGRSEHGRLTQVDLRGEIETTSGGLLHVRNRLAVDTRGVRPYVLTNLYRYHGRAQLRGRLIDVFRYDNSHGDTGTLHRHIHDSEGVELGEEPVALEELPPLSRIVRDVEFYARYLAEAGA